MNVLIDRHHAGLLYSLQLLFEDRLGMDVYVPVGHEWWDEGYWRFGQVFGDDRLAQQYLMPNPPWKIGENEYEPWETYDVEFPSRRIRGATLQAARHWGGWDYVVATVQENAAGLHRFAQEAGAQFVYQVGNNGQRIDWSLNPLVLASAKIEFPEGQRGVTYHQEFDKDGTFAFRDPVWHRSDIVRSFVNCFPLMPTEWRRFQEFQRAAPEMTYMVHGHDGPDGLVQPTTMVADVMANSGWGYHDKPQGDGFGHVIHYWAAVGRPLIGSASYYRGLFAEHLWEDGVTAIDLSIRSVEEAAEMALQLAASKDWIEMCHHIRDRLDQLVDFDAEAAAIRELLGA